MSAGTGRRSVTTIAIVFGFAVAGCGGGSGTSPGSLPTPSEIATGVPDLPSQGTAPTLEPSPTPQPPSPVAEWPSPTPAGPSPCDDARPAPTTRPPDDPRITGLLTTPGSDGILGVLGSSELDGVGSDSPFLPFASGRVAPIPPAVIVTIQFGDGAAIGRWSALLADARNRDGLPQVRLDGREAESPPLDAAHLSPLPVGCWVLEVSLRRADNRGGGVTFWSISVTAQP